MKREIELLKRIFPELKNCSEEEILSMFNASANKNEAYINGPSVMFTGNTEKDNSYAILFHTINIARENNRKLKGW